MKTFIPEFLAGLSIGIAILALIHQHLTTNDVWFNLHEFQHHESVMACFVVAAIALLVGKYLGRG